MNKITSIALSLLSTNLLIGCAIGDNEVPEAPIAFPRTCAERAVGHAEAQDGTYTLFVEGDETMPWRAYCADMGEDAIEYLTLATSGAGTWSSYRAGGRSPGTDVDTRFDKVRIDPIKLVLDVNDLTFAVSTGSVNHLGGKAIDSMPLGVAMSCGGGSVGAQVDLQGTPFLLTGEFAIGGDAGNTGNADPWSTNQTMEMWADGDCGFVGPKSINPMAPTGTSIAVSYKK
jgi:hypothetical protein